MRIYTRILLLCGSLLSLSHNPRLVAQDRDSGFKKSRDLIGVYQSNKSDAALQDIVDNYQAKYLGANLLARTKEILPSLTTEQQNRILIPALEGVLESGSVAQPQRRGAFSIIETLGSKGGLLEPVILEHLKKGDPIEGIFALSSLDAIGPLSSPAVELLKKKLSEPSNAKCDQMTELCLPAMMIRVLGKSGRQDQGIFETIQGRLKDNNRFVKCEAIRYVVGCNGFDKESVDEILVEMRSGDGDRVWLVLSLLSDLVFDSRVKAVPDTIKDYVVEMSKNVGNPETQQQALEVLEEINNSGK